MALTKVLTTAGGLVPTLVLFLALLAIKAFWPEASEAAGQTAVPLIDLGLWASGAFLATRLVRLVVLGADHGLSRKRRVPRLIVDLIAVVIWLAALFGVIKFVFDQPVSGLLATSGVAIAIIGFSLRDVTANLFTGLALNVEQTYRIGDWIELADGSVARVDEIRWFTTSATTRDNVRVTFPNSMMATEPVRNYGGGERLWRDQVAVTVDHVHDPDRIRRLLVNAMLATEPVRTTAVTHAPDAIAESFTEDGIRWLARYWLASYADMALTQDTVLRSIQAHLHHAGIPIAYRKHDVFRADMPHRQLDPRRHLMGLLVRNSLFSSLENAKVAAIAEAAHEVRLLKDMPVVNQSEPGRSLFVIIEGLVRVSCRSRDGGEHELNRLGPGDMFGEFSLLTGAPRSATVVAVTDLLAFEIDKAVIEPLLQNEPEIAEQLSHILEQRQANTLNSLNQALKEELAPTMSKDRSDILESVRRFFGL